MYERDRERGLFKTNPFRPLELNGIETLHMKERTVEDEQIH